MSCSVQAQRYFKAGYTVARYIVTSAQICSFMPEALKVVVLSLNIKFVYAGHEFLQINRR